MSKRSHYWKSPYWIPALLFSVFLIHGGVLGLTDDEAYYWVLSQRPALGYAYHPPGVAWAIALASRLFGWIPGLSPEALLRLPAAGFAAAIVALGMKWMELAGAPRERLWRGGLLLLFPGFFGAAWMMVPDLPLFAGWMLAYYCTWKICFSKATVSRGALLGLAAGIALSLLSKYSAVFAAFSALICVWFWAPVAARAKASVAVVAGCVIAGVPILLWNMNHEWASILYQIRDRHGSPGLSAVRYLRFWVIQLFLAGPILVVFALSRPLNWFSKINRRSDGMSARVSRFALVWALPALLVFGLQPAWSEFKAHWIFIAWLPAALELGWRWTMASPDSGDSGISRWARVQCVYGVSLTLLVLSLCHVPLGSWAAGLWTGKDLDPRWDVTNDMYGWSGLAEFLSKNGGPDALQLPVVGSRYQTAAQAAFALKDSDRVAFLPRSLGERDEWPTLSVSDHSGPGWPKLKSPVLFVADHRYHQGPAFESGDCQKLGRMETLRGKFLARWVDVWRCDPK